VRAADAEPVARVGDVLLSRFRLTRIIGRGGMGVVFAANDLQMQGEPQIAIKLLNEDMRDFPVAAMALERECRKVRMLAHDAIVRVFEFYRSGETTFITMELLEGESLDVIIKRFPQGIAPADAWPIIRACGDALMYAHRQKPAFVHSDFKPSNVFVTHSSQVKVLDFGVARAARAADTVQTNLSIFDPAKYGALTPAYASAEMLAGLSADTRDDVYALACVAYEALCGEHPFARRPADQARALMLKPNVIPALGGRINRALRSGLAVDRIDRTPSVAQFLEELGEPPMPPEVRRRRLKLFGTIAASAAAAIVVGLGLWRLIPMIHLPARGTPNSAPQSTAIRAPVDVRVPGANTPTPAPADKLSAPPALAPGMIAGDRALALLQLLGVPTIGIGTGSAYPEAKLRQLIENSPRKVVLGSSAEQMQAAFALCLKFSSKCKQEWYSDEKQHTATLDPFELDAAPVSVREFRRFADAASYKTEAELAGGAYAVVEQGLQPVDGGNWRNAVKQHAVNDDDAVVGVSFRDAQSYCRYRKQRLPTEDEWEYVARGPERRTFPWGESVTPAERSSSTAPHVLDGPAEGIGLRYRGMSGNVWQWVDTTDSAGRKILKGGSWRQSNPANRRSAAHLMQQATLPDSDSGFRCARSVPTWPDTDIWLARLK
jgi:serine/threonine protein kinase